ncbi:MAG: zinc ABC transporter substrate-binding protein [Planctomycetaceae bacterium]
MKAASLIVLAAFLCCGCQHANEPDPGSGGGAVSAEAGIRVVATVGMVADLVRQVGGDRVQVTQMMGAGVDPHLYNATRDDVQTIMNGDLVFYSGLMLEGKLIDTLEKMAERKPVIAITSDLARDTLLEPEDMHGHFDPHVWMDVSAWSQCVDRIAATLAEHDPPHADQYRKNASEYRRQLEQLHNYGRTCISSIPEDSRVLVTSHDAFNYLGRAYGLDVQGVQGISTESEAGLQRVNDLVDMLVSRSVRAVFVESSVPRKSISALLEGARSRGHQVVIGGELFSDAMGPAGTYEGTYIGMLDHNFTIITRALGGTAPESGLNGKLTTTQPTE